MAGTLSRLALAAALTLTVLFPRMGMAQRPRSAARPGAVAAPRNPVGVQRLGLQKANVQKANVQRASVQGASVQGAAHHVPADLAAYDDMGLDCDSCASGPMAVGLDACGPPAVCLPLWGSIEYLLWWERDAKYPPLATTSPSGTPRGTAGVLGLDSTSILFGGDDHPVESGNLSGARLTVGLWLDPCQNISVVGRGFGIEDHDAGFSAVANGRDILARPFFNAFTDEQDALLLGYPNAIRGNLQIAQSTRVNGAQAMLRQMYCHGGNYRVDLVYGYRYLGVDESLKITNSLEFTDPQEDFFGTTIDQLDLFDLENNFHGGDLGLAGHSEDGRWTLDFLATIGLGSMRQRAQVRGNTVTTPDGGNPTTVAGGLLTQRSNIGQYSADPFTVVPEFTATLGYQVTPRMDVSIGYTFLYANHVARPGQVIDTSVNLSQQTGVLEGPAVPIFQFRDTDYWLQGLNFGLNLRF